ncbi:hypothetical protein SeLEV6574_g08329 [Synchytrium endobioticum]|uniref:Uncharacterized protein n=1 Tax=Synchytrium endobioticum TaxID=286115 RepID=A0A507C3I9_9FUNG|nr:hypothetical protein SeLEV6574_g08329 [Synchytrium endobioticum]
MTPRLFRCTGRMLLSLRPYEPRIVSSPTTKYTKHIPLSYFRHPRIRHSLPATSAPFHSYHEISSSATGSTDIIHADLRTAIRNYVHSYIQHAQLSTSAVSMNPATGYTRDPSMSRFSFDTYRLVRQLERQNLDNPGTNANQNLYGKPILPYAFRTPGTPIRAVPSPPKRYIDPQISARPTHAGH